MSATILEPATRWPQHLVTSSSIEDDGLGEELNAIWEIEPGARVIEDVSLRQATGVDEPGTHDAFIDAVHWGAASSANVRSLQPPFGSGIDIEDYQLNPVVRAIEMPRANLLVADDAVFGKTIEAGLVVNLLGDAVPRFVAIEEAKTRLVTAGADADLLVALFMVAGKYDTTWQAVLLLEYRECTVVEILSYDKIEVVWSASWMVSH